MEVIYKTFAAVYGCGTYGGGSFDTGTACAATSTTSPADGGSLPPTGTSIIYGLAGGILLIVVAIVLLVSARQKKRK